MSRKSQPIRIAAISAATAAAMVLGASAMAAEPEGAIERWLGTEITIESSSVNDLMPVGGKLTLIFDSEDNTVRVCTRTAPNQRGPWRMDMMPGCNVALVVTKAQRYCTVEDVKAGNAEVLSACHRLRSHDVALRPSRVKGAIELHDVIVFPVESSGNRKLGVAILIDSPSRVTDGGVVVGTKK